ncbi:MAG: tRNA (adenosine(37)-N6)-dimethylallyltransferase MiaA [Acidobacteriota bacterium]
MARGVGTVLVGILGPTGSGKSRLSITLAKHFDGEVVGCDALQVYRGVDVGTGKLSSAARAGIPHYLLDVVEPDGEFSAADYVREAAPVVRDISRRGKLPLVVGGTGLYFRSLRRGLFEGPGRVPKLRARISRVAGRRGTAYVHRMLCRRDPTSAARIHPNDLVRTIRALEVTLLSSRPMSDVMRERRRRLEGFQFSLVGLSPPREELRRRIDIRVRRMFDEGLVDEVRRLQERYGTEIPAFKAIGYREVGRY